MSSEYLFVGLRHHLLQVVNECGFKERLQRMLLHQIGKVQGAANADRPRERRQVPVQGDTRHTLRVMVVR